MKEISAISLGEYLVKRGYITEEQYQNAINVQKKEGFKIGSVLMKLGYLTEDQIFQALSELYGYPMINISTIEVDPQATKLIPLEMMKKYKAIPFHRVGNTVRVAFCDPSKAIVEHIKFLLAGFNVEIYMMKFSEMNAYFREVERKAEEDEKKQEAVDEIIESAVIELSITDEKISEEEVVQIDAPIIKLANKIIHDAIKMGASDIHIEPSEKILAVRYRIDGVLQNVLSLPLQIKSALIVRFKIMSHMDISERRLPQDGRIKAIIAGKEVDFRVSSVPIINGEKIVLRILEKGSLQLDLTKLGFEDRSLKFFLESLEKPYGMILVTGPTGSGKTTTLYSALMKINTPEVNIMTIEDPVEYSFPGINQVQVKEEIGLTFANALRSFLRQDPDIIMVGEIRDFETAEIAVKAALTGHLVLSTLHTNDAASTITRLVNMGIEPFLISSSVLIAAAQRLVRKLCPKCKKEESVSEDILLNLGFTKDEIKNLKVYAPQGCSECHMTGYKGRIALFEVMPITEEIKKLILTGASDLEIKKEAVKQGMITLRRSGLYKIMQGITSIKEVVRVTFED